MRCKASLSNRGAIFFSMNYHSTWLSSSLPLLKLECHLVCSLHRENLSFFYCQMRGSPKSKFDSGNAKISWRVDAAKNSCNFPRSHRLVCTLTRSRTHMEAEICLANTEGWGSHLWTSPFCFCHHQHGTKIQQILLT